MSIHVDLLPEEVADLKRRTKRDNEAEALAAAAREYLRWSKVRELKAVCGKVEFDLNWQELEDLELAETDFPQ